MHSIKCTNYQEPNYNNITGTKILILTNSLILFYTQNAYTNTHVCSYSLWLSTTFKESYSFTIKSLVTRKLSLDSCAGTVSFTWNAFIINDPKYQVYVSARIEQHIHHV